MKSFTSFTLASILPMHWSIYTTTSPKCLPELLGVFYLRAVGNKRCTVYYEVQELQQKTQYKQNLLMELLLKKCLLSVKIKEHSLWCFTHLLCFQLYVALNFHWTDSLKRFCCTKNYLSHWHIYTSSKINFQCLCTHTFYIGI